VAGFTGGRLVTANAEHTQRAFQADVSTLLGHNRINCSVTRGAETRRNMEAQSLGHFELLPTVRPSESLTSDWSVLDSVANDLYRAGRSDIALEMLEAAVQTMPLDGNLHFIHGRMLAASNRRTEALAALSRALALGTEREVLTVVADVAFPGPCYKEHLARLHMYLNPATYLEIGVFCGETLCLARSGTSAIGIDPAPRPEANRVYQADTLVHQLTSDAYFAAIGAGEIASPAPIGLAFIDGLHLFEQVLRDFINTEKLCQRDGVIVLHDMLPIASAAATRQRATSFWCGDVWKVVPCIKRYRQDLSILTIPTHPSGLTLVTGLDPNSTTLADCFGSAVQEFRDVPLERTALEDGMLGDVANDWRAVREWLAGGPAGERLIR
jgi:tetratricopeptide (TPR) repeat protein